MGSNGLQVSSKPDRNLIPVKEHPGNISGLLTSRRRLHGRFRQVPVEASGMALLGSIRGKLLALMLAAVVPFLALMGAGLWGQWRDTQTAAMQRALNDARILAAQVDDHIGNLEHLLAGLSRAVSADSAVACQRCPLAPGQGGAARFHQRHRVVFARRREHRQLVGSKWAGKRR
jgi:hypothetical protein